MELTRQNQRRESKPAYLSLIVLSFLTMIALFAEAGWADVGPTVSGEVQGEKQGALAPRSSAVGREKVKKEGEEGGTTAWFDTVRKKLTSETFEVHPRVRTEYVLDDNVLLESRDEKMDSIFREVPGVEVILPFHNHYLKASYYSELEQFVKFPRENTENQYFKSEVAVNLTDLYFRVEESITHTASRSGTTFSERIPRFENNVDALAGYKFNGFTLEGGYTNFFRNFNTSREDPLDYRTNKWYGKLKMDVTAKTKVFVDYAFTGYNYFNDDSRDGKGNAIYGGIEGAILPKTTLYSKFGYERIAFDRAGETDSDNFVAEVGALYQPLAKTSIDLGWTRETVQATFADANFFTQDKIFGRVRQRLTEKITAETSVAYTNQDYEKATAVGVAPGVFVGRKRNDELLTADVKFAYWFTDWLSADIKYQYNRRNSNASLFDYTNNLLTVGLALQA